MSTITTSTPLTGTSTGTLNEAMRYADLMGTARPQFLSDYLTAVYELAPQVGLRADLAVAQSVHETNAWRSSWWIDRGNPAGIGITGTPAQDNASGTWATGRDAAKAQLVHLLGYLRGSAPAVAEPWIALDPRWSALMTSGMAGTAQTIGDFGDGVWATDPDYADKWVSRFADVFNRFDVPVEEPPAGGTPVATKPTIILTAGHRSDGDAGNPDEKSRTPALAHAYQSAFEAAGFTTHYVQNEDGDGRPDIVTGGLDTVGQLTRSLMAGISGEMVLLDLHYEGADARGVFGIVPDVTGLVTAIAGGAPADDTWANNPLDVALARQIAKNISALTGLPLRATTEPGVMSERATGVGIQGYRLAMMAYTSGFRDRAIRLVVEHGSLPTADKGIITTPGFEAKCASAAVAAVAQVYGVPSVPVDPQPEHPKYALPSLPAWLKDPDVAVRTLNGVKVYPVRQRYTATKETPRKQATGNNRKIVGPPLKAGESIEARYAYRSGDRTIVLDDGGVRFYASDLSPRVQITKSGTISIRFGS